MITVKNEEGLALNKPETIEEHQQTKEQQQLNPYRSIDDYGEELLRSANRRIVDFLS